MTSSRSNKASRVLRALHRDVGFLLAGVSVVYALSGILLNHMDGKDPAYRVTAGRATFAPSLSLQELTTEWQARAADLPALRRALPIDSTRLQLLFDGGTGIYDRASGRADYELHRRRPLVYWINKLHYNQIRGWSPVADFFAGSLIFLAVSGLLIVRGKRGVLGSGKWYLLAGLLLPALYILYSIFSAR